MKDRICPETGKLCTKGCDEICWAKHIKDLMIEKNKPSPINPFATININNPTILHIEIKYKLQKLVENLLRG